MSARPTTQRRIKTRASDRREARIRELEKAIRWTLDYLRMDLPSRAIRRGAEGLADAAGGLGGERDSRGSTHLDNPPSKQARYLMGYAHGQNNNGRNIGYGVNATCDHEDCGVKIDRGIAYCCGGVEGIQNAGMDDTPYCGGFFCYEHLFYVEGVDESVCATCAEKAPEIEDVSA